VKVSIPLHNKLWSILETSFIKLTKKERELAKTLVITIAESFKKQGVKVKDSNIFHFVAYRVNKKCKLGLATGWFKHGAYILAIDDALIELGMMEKEQHQLYGDEKALPIEEWIKKTERKKC